MVIRDIKDILIFLYQERFICALELREIEEQEVIDESFRGKKNGELYMLDKVIKLVRPAYDELMND